MRKSHTKVAITMLVDHTATASVWSRLFLGILDGTKLADAWRVSEHAGATDPRARRRLCRLSARWTYSTLTWRFATTGLSGAEEKDEMRSRMLEEESVRVADARVRLASIADRLERVRAGPTLARMGILCALIDRNRLRSAGLLLADTNEEASEHGRVARCRSGTERRGPALDALIRIKRLAHPRNVSHAHASIAALDQPAFSRPLSARRARRITENLVRFIQIVH